MAASQTSLSARVGRGRDTADPLGTQGPRGSVPLCSNSHTGLGTGCQGAGAEDTHGDGDDGSPGAAAGRRTQGGGVQVSGAKHRGPVPVHFPVPVAPGRTQHSGTTPSHERVRV